MKYSDFEKHIKKELDGSKESVQMDALLSSLNLGHKTDKRKGFAFWMILPFLLVTLSAIAWKYTDIVKYADETYLSEELSVPQDIIKAELEPERFSTVDINSSTKETGANTSTNSVDKPFGASNEVAVSSKSSKTTKEYPTIENTTINNNTTNINSRTTINSTPVINDQPSAEFQNVELNQKNEETDSRDMESSNFENEKASASVIENEDRVAITNSAAKSIRSQLSVATLNMSIEALNDNDVDANLFSRMKINCPSFDNAGWHVALIPEVGLFKPFKTLEMNSLEEPSDAFNERLKAESTLEGIELGLHGMLVRDNVPLYLKVGASYSRISERMDLKFDYTVKDTVIGVISETYSENGDTLIKIEGPIERETLHTGSNRQHHYIHLFDIPVSIGYTTYIGGLDIGIEAGIRMNFMTRATGNLLTSRKEYTNLSLNRLFKNKIGLSYFGGLMIGRNFGKFGDFYVAPRFTYFPNEFNNELNNVSQKYFAVGLSAGVVYKIN